MSAPGARPSRAMLLTHSQPQDTSSAVRAAVEAAGDAGCELVAPPSEHDKHASAMRDVGTATSERDSADLCLVLGGDGTILWALGLFAHTGAPIYGINFGTTGFLAASEREELSEGLHRAFTGEYEVLDMAGLAMSGGVGDAEALNDVSFTRRPHGRVAELSYAIGGQEVGHVRCDGLVAATPAGSTGYNLANGGPILAWGVEGFVVSFVAPHSLTARALVVAPNDVLHVRNAAGREPVDVAVDGVRHGALEPGGELEICFIHGVSRLAQIAGTNFYQRIREKFGRLAH